MACNATNKLRNVVGRVTPCAPFSKRQADCGAHGVTRPNDPERIFRSFSFPARDLVCAARLIAALRDQPPFTRLNGISMNPPTQNFLSVFAPSNTVRE